MTCAKSLTIWLVNINLICQYSIQISFYEAAHLWAMNCRYWLWNFHVQLKSSKSSHFLVSKDGIVTSFYGILHLGFSRRLSNCHKLHNIPVKYIYCTIHAEVNRDWEAKCLTLRCLKSLWQIQSLLYSKEKEGCLIAKHQIDTLEILSHFFPIHPLFCAWHAFRYLQVHP